MSETLLPHLSVLLPQARIVLFVQDQNLITAANNLKNDWRFARIKIETHAGDVHAAIAHFSNAQSPDLLLIETQIIDESFTTALEKLSEVCAENTGAIIIGPVNDVYLYRKLIDMGVNDYLVGPLSKEILTDVLAKSIIDKMGQSGARLFAFAGAKGGLGTSTLAHYSALITSERLNQKTLLIDLSGAWSYLTVAFGVEASTNLAELCKMAQSSDQDAFKRLITNINEKFSILPTGLEKLLDETVGAEQFENLLNHLMVTYPLIIIDTSHAPIALKKLVLNRAHEIFILSNPSLSSLRTARALIAEIKDMHGSVDENIDLIITMQGMSTEFEVAVKDIEKAIDKNPTVLIPFMPKVFMSEEAAGRRNLNNKDLQFIFDSLENIFRKILKCETTQEVNIQNTKNENFFDSLLKTLKQKG